MLARIIAYPFVVMSVVALYIAFLFEGQVGELWCQYTSRKILGE